MSNDLRDSLRIWAAAIALAAIFWALLRADVFGLVDRVPSNWFWLVVGAATIWEAGRFGWGLWRRRARRGDEPAA